MYTFLLPFVKATVLYKVTKQEGRCFFDLQDMAGTATKGSLTPNHWSTINGIEDPVVTKLEKKGDPATSQGRFINIRQFMDSNSTKAECANLLSMASEQQLISKGTLYTVDYSDDNTDPSQILLSSHLSYNDALAVAMGDESRISKKESWIGTHKLSELLGISQDIAIADGELHATIAMLESLSVSWKNVDGIIWSEKVDGLKNDDTFCSIFRSKEDSWKSTIVKMPEQDSDLSHHQSKLLHSRYTIPFISSLQHQSSSELSM